MMKRTLWATLAVALAAGLAIAPGSSRAYEAATTHAGLTEQAAAHSKLHKRLSELFGYQRGLFEPLIVPPADAEPLFTVLRRFNPTHGYVPDARGRQSALGWLVAGSVVADSPPRQWANHFFDPLSGKGLTDSTLSSADRALRLRLEQRMAGDQTPRSGLPAIAWVNHPDNPMGLAGFRAQYEKAVRARTPGERERHLAGALLAAGALLHVLQDMGSPSHVRNDLAAHLERVGAGRLDVGSRFERVAALAYGRLGVPAPQAPVERSDVRAFFTAADRGGLADITTRRWFSAGTLPKPISMRGQVSNQELAQKLQASVRRPAPVPLPRLDLFAAARDGGATLVDGDGVCAARYQIRKAQLTWSLDDDCYLEQLAALMPLVSAYSAGLLDHLFRGQLSVLARDQGLVVGTAGVDFGKGKVELFWDDDRGVRTKFAETAVEGASVNKALARAPRPPAGAKAVSVLFSGVDGKGQPLVATGRVEL